eukprot:787224-Amorphochlora_amoeboformis.AAC.3
MLTIPLVNAGLVRVKAESNEGKSEDYVYRKGFMKEGPEFGKAGKMGEAADDVPHDFHPEIERQA